MLMYRQDNTHVGRMTRSAFLGVMLMCTPVLGAKDLPSIQPFVMPNARAAALGGFHAALTDDFSSVFNNPAGLAALEAQKVYAELIGEVNNMTTLYDMLSGNMDGLSILKREDRIDASAVLGGPVSFGSVANGFGWRIFNATRANMIWDRDDVFVLDLNPLFSEELAVHTGYGWRIGEGGSTMDLGIAVKGFYRVLYAPEQVFIQEIKHILEQMNENRYISELGASFDVGFRWTRDDSFSFAVVYKDFWSPAMVTYYENAIKFLQGKMFETGTNKIPPRLSVGFAVRFPSPIMHRWNTDIIIAADYHGLVELIQRNNERYEELFFSAGIELRFLEVVSIRAGWSDWLPAAGFGINFTGFKFDVSLSGKEQGRAPGEHPTFVATVGLQFQY